MTVISLSQGVVAVYWCSVQHVHSFPHAPHTVHRGRPFQLGLVLSCPKSMAASGHLLLLLLPLWPPPVPSHGHTSAGAHPALMAQARVVLVMLLAIGDRSGWWCGETDLCIRTGRVPPHPATALCPELVSRWGCVWGCQVLEQVMYEDLCLG